MNKKYIKLTQGKRAIVDKIDFDRLNKFKWHAAKYHGEFASLNNI